MGHSDQAMTELAAYEKRLDADAEFDDAVDAKQRDLAADFARSCYLGNVTDCEVLADALANLRGEDFALLIGNLHGGGGELQKYLNQVAYAHTLTKAVDQVRNATARGKS